MSQGLLHCEVKGGKTLPHELWSRHWGGEIAEIYTADAGEC